MDGLCNRMSQPEARSTSLPQPGVEPLWKVIEELSRLARETIYAVVDDGAEAGAQPDPAASWRAMVRFRQQNDPELIAACLQGNRDAWTVLIERHGGLIYSIAWKSKLAPEDVADVFQSVILDVLSGLDRLKDHSKFRSWLTSIAIHHCMRLKRRHRQAFVNLDEVAEQAANVADTQPLPDEVLETLEKQQLVRHALAMMDEPCRHLLTRLFFDDELKSYEEIAEELGFAVSTIGPKRGRCLRKLLLTLQQLGF